MIVNLLLDSVKDKQVQTPVYQAKTGTISKRLDQLIKPLAA